MAVKPPVRKRAAAIVVVAFDHARRRVIGIFLRDLFVVRLEVAQPQHLHLDALLLPFDQIIVDVVEFGLLRLIFDQVDDVLNAFPSVNFRFTVFGQYSNLRTFINELEREKQFILINSVNLTNQEAKTASRRGKGTEGAGGIMLTIEMAAYFQPS